MAKWYSKRLEVIAEELEALINATRDEDGHHYLSEALRNIMDADDNIGNSGVTFA